MFIHLLAATWCKPQMHWMNFAGTLTLRSYEIPLWLAIYCPPTKPLFFSAATAAAGWEQRELLQNSTIHSIEFLKFILPPFLDFSTNISKCNMNRMKIVKCKFSKKTSFLNTFCPRKSSWIFKLNIYWLRRFRLKRTTRAVGKCSNLALITSGAISVGRLLLEQNVSPRW